jgi:hypothetical protein
VRGHLGPEVGSESRADEGLRTKRTSIEA